MCKLQFPPTPSDQVHALVVHCDMQERVFEIMDFEHAERKEVNNHRKLAVSAGYEIVVADFYGDDQMMFSAGFIKSPTDRRSLQAWGKRLENWQDPELLVQSLVLRKPIDLE